MIEGIPAFFAAGKYGIGVISAMAVVFAARNNRHPTSRFVSTRRQAFFSASVSRPFERYGEVMSGVFIALVGVAFWIWRRRCRQSGMVQN